MYQYGKDVGRLAPDAPLVSLNCADYAANPQLLVSQLFGHVKGAFTGADREHAGLVERADGGVLFLDEIHRLPPEGQVMLFYLLDFGTYRKLGESTGERRAKVLLVGATSEEPESMLLRAFRRRMPILINLPPLDRRPTSERLALATSFLQAEARRIGRGIVVASSVLKCLLTYPCPGNAGQLRSDIQWACAQAYLGTVGREEGHLSIDLPALPGHVQAALQQNDHKPAMRDLYRLISADLLVRHDVAEDALAERSNGGLAGARGGNDSGRPGGAQQRRDPWLLPTELYERLYHKYDALRTEGFEPEEVAHVLSGEIENYSRQLLQQWDYGRPVPADIAKLIDEPLFEAVSRVLGRVAEQFGVNFPRRVVYGLSIHLSTLLQRLETGKVVAIPFAERMTREHAEALPMATQVLADLEHDLSIRLPPDEAAVISAFLSSPREDSAPTVGVTVVMHGRSTASSMAEVANTLFGVDHARAVDMPLDMSPQLVLERLAEVVAAADRGNGVLLLVDMGSLLTFGAQITEQTGIEVDTVPMATTPMVIEAVSKGMIPGTSLREVKEAVESLAPLIGRLQHFPPNGRRKDTILTTCLTGRGTAQRLKHFLERALPELEENGIQIRAVETLADGRPEQGALPVAPERVLLLVGTRSLTIGAPYVAIDELFTEQGVSRLRAILQLAIPHVDWGRDGRLARQLTSQLSLSTVLEKLTVLNPTRVVNSCSRAIDSAEASLSIRWDSGTVLRLLVHMGCMLDRLVTERESLDYDDWPGLKAMYPLEFGAMQQACEMLGSEYGVTVVPSEVAYLTEIVAGFGNESTQG